MEKKNGAKGFIKNTLIFFVGTVLSKMVSFLMMPLYTAKVPTDQMGVFDTSVTLVTMLFSICYFEIWSAALRFLYSKEYSTNKGGITQAGWKIFAISTLIFSILCIIMCIIMRYEYIYLVVGYGIATALSNQITFIARGVGLNKQFSISGIINTLVHLSLNVLLLTAFDLDYSALYISFIAGVFAQVLFLGICIKKSGRLTNAENQDKKLLLKEMLKYALPLCLNTVSYWFLSSFNRVVYNRIFGDHASGIFSIGSRFGSIIALATTCFTYAWQDLAFSNANNAEGERVELYITACDKYQQFLTAATAMLLPLLNLIFPLLVKGDYTDALSLVPSFVVVAVVSAYSSFIGNIFYAIKDTKIISISTVISAVTNLAICYPLIRFLGGLGTNLATIVAFILNIAVRAIVLKKKIKFNIKIKNILLSSLWLLVTIFGYYIDNMFIQAGLLVLNIIIAFIMFKRDIIKIFHPRSGDKA